MLKKRGLLTLPVLLVAIAALALGSVGTATAGGLTTHAVKKIAAKVVKKKAKTLTVANATHATTATTATSAGTASTATTAGNANTLAGQPASAYQNQTYVYTTDVAAGTSSVTIPITPPAGNYLISYSAYLSLDNNSDAQIDCYVDRRQGGNDSYFAESYFYTNDAVGGASGSGFTTIGNGVTAELDCSADDTFGTFSTEPIQITATRVDNVSSSSIAPMLQPAATKQRQH